MHPRYGPSAELDHSRFRDRRLQQPAGNEVQQLGISRSRRFSRGMQLSCAKERRTHRRTPIRAVQSQVGITAGKQRESDHRTRSAARGHIHGVFCWHSYLRVMIMAPIACYGRKTCSWLEHRMPLASNEPPAVHIVDDDDSLRVPWRKPKSGEAYCGLREDLQANPSQSRGWGFE